MSFSVPDVFVAFALKTIIFMKRIAKPLILLRLRNQSNICLELAGSRDKEGWIGIGTSRRDTIIHNLYRSLPFPDGTVSKIYSSHVLEHFYYNDLKKLLTECLRVLESGGELRACIPDARIYINGYLNPESFDEKQFCGYQPARHIHTPIDYLNFIAYLSGSRTNSFDNHRMLFDDKNLVAILTDIGFVDVSLSEFDVAIDVERRKINSLYITAKKRL